MSNVIFSHTFTRLVPAGAGMLRVTALYSRSVVLETSIQNGLTFDSYIGADIV